MTMFDQIETRTFTTPSWVIFPPDSVRIVNWKISRVLHLDRVIEFLTGTKTDILLLCCNQRSKKNVSKLLHPLKQALQHSRQHTHA